VGDYRPDHRYVPHLHLSLHLPSANATHDARHIVLQQYSSSLQTHFLQSSDLTPCTLFGPEHPGVEWAAQQSTGQGRPQYLKNDEG